MAFTIRPTQSIDLLKHLHILTEAGRMNLDSRRKLKQIYHLEQLVKPLLLAIKQQHNNIILVDHGAGKSYLGFILNDLLIRHLNDKSHIYAIEHSLELVEKSKLLAQQLHFNNMTFIQSSIFNSIDSIEIPTHVDIVTALHACDTATDDAITFAIKRKVQYLVLIPCCQAEISQMLKHSKTDSEIFELWRHPIHTREFGSHLTNVLRCLYLEAHGYNVTVTELVGWEHSMKNELIIAKYVNKVNYIAKDRLTNLLKMCNLMNSRFAIIHQNN